MHLKISNFHESSLFLPKCFIDTYPKTKPLSITNKPKTNRIAFLANIKLSKKYKINKPTATGAAAKPKPKKQFNKRFKPKNRKSFSKKRR